MLRKQYTYHPGNEIFPVGKVRGATALAASFCDDARMSMPLPRRRSLLRALAISPLLAAAPFASSPAMAADAPLLKRTLPKTKVSLTAVGLGTWQSFDVAGEPAQRAEAVQALRRFAELGGELVDSSPMYGSSEAVLGEAAEELNLHKKLFLATKVWTSGRTEGVRQMETSLRRMRVSLKGPLDLMQVHNLVDAKTHLATLRAWKREGRIRYLGITHYTASAYADLERELKAGGIDFLQVNFSLAEREAGTRLLAAARDAGAAVLVNRPFAEGALFARVKGRALPAVAQDAGCASWAQFFLKWILARPEVTCVIPGTRNPLHVTDNLALLTSPLPDAALAARMAAAFDAGTT